MINNDLYIEDTVQPEKTIQNYNKNEALIYSTSTNSEGIKEHKKEYKNEQKEEEKKEDNKKEEKQKVENKNENEKDINQNYNTVHIGLNIDNKYGYPLIVFLTSLFENRKPSTNYDITILTCMNMNKNYINKINELNKRYGTKNIKITYINMQKDFRGAITDSHISRSAYYRIALPLLLPNVDKIIYSDVDVLNFKDLTEMYNLELKDDIYLKATLDIINPITELKQFGIITKKYFNSGVLLMNLKSMRKDGIEKKIRNFIYNHYLEHHDQTAMNAVCYNNWEILSIKYATFVHNTYKNIVDYNNKQDVGFRYSEEELKLAYYEPTLLHYAGWSKPWNEGYSKKKGEYWWYYAKQSGFYDEIVQYYGFNKEYIDDLIDSIPEDGGLIKNNYKKS